MALDNLRCQIDEIDERIIDLVAQRFTLTREVGRVKIEQKLDPVDVTREESQLRRFRDLARQQTLNPELIAAIYRLIIDEVVRNHRTVR